MDGRLMDFRPVFRNRAAMAYILGYAAHMWELFSMRSWVVAFLVYCSHLQPASSLVWRPTQVAALINLIGVPASIAGNELSRRFGRRKTVMRIMLASAFFSVLVGFSAPLPYMLVVMLCLVYGVLVIGDSASLTAGAVAAASENSRGATLAVHSTLGFGAAFFRSGGRRPGTGRAAGKSRAGLGGGICLHGRRLRSGAADDTTLSPMQEMEPVTDGDPAVVLCVF